MATIAVAFALLLSIAPSIEAGRNIHERSLTQAPATIASVAAGVPQLSTLVAAVSASPTILAAATNPNTTVTVFAPTNEAFAALLATLNTSATALLANTELLTNVLAYHIIPSVIKSTDIPSGTTMVTTLQGQTVTVVKGSTGITVNGANVIQADVAAGLSIVHVIDRVLIPPPAPAPETIASVAATVLDLSTLVAAVSASPSILAAATNPQTAVTVFAPTNAAFADALHTLGLTADELLSAKYEHILTAILQNHIIPAGVILAKDVPNRPANVRTLLPGGYVTVQNRGGTVYVNKAKVITADVHAGASVVHVIDQVLIPSWWTILGARALRWFLSLYR